MKAFQTACITTKDNKSTYNKLLQHIFEFGQELRDATVPELGWKPFNVSEHQDMKSSQLCINRGDATKQISYFCHLCQKHSDDIARPNRMARGKSARICDKALRYHYPMMDYAVIRKLLADIKEIEKTDQAQRLWWRLGSLLCCLRFAFGRFWARQAGMKSLMRSLTPKVFQVFGKHGNHFEHPWPCDRSQKKCEAQDKFYHQGLAYYEEICTFP
jgi:hypothetical protein